MLLIRNPQKLLCIYRRRLSNERQRKKKEMIIQIISPVLLAKQLLLWLHKNDNKNNNNTTTNTIVHSSRDNNTGFDLRSICVHCVHIRSNRKKTINSLKLIRTPNANVLYVCHMHISSMIDHSITSCDREKKFYDDDEWSMSILIHLPSLSLSFSQLEFYSSRRDQTFFIY